MPPAKQTRDTFYGFPVIPSNWGALLLAFCPWCPEEKARADAMEGKTHRGKVIHFSSRMCRVHATALRAAATAEPAGSMA